MEVSHETRDGGERCLEKTESEGGNQVVVQRRQRCLEETGGGDDESWPLSVLDCRAPSPTKIENRELNLEWVLFARLFEFSDCRSVRSFEFQTFRFLDFLHFFLYDFWGEDLSQCFLPSTESIDRSWLGARALLISQ